MTVLATAQLPITADPAKTFTDWVATQVDTHPNWTVVEEVTYTKSSVARTALILRASPTGTSNGEPMVLALSRRTTAGADMWATVAEDWDATEKNMLRGPYTGGTVDTTGLASVTAYPLSSTFYTELALGNSTSVWSTTNPLDAYCYIDDSTLTFGHTPGSTTQGMFGILTQVTPLSGMSADLAKGCHLIASMSSAAMSALGVGTRATAQNTSGYVRAFSIRGAPEGLVSNQGVLPDRTTGRIMGTRINVVAGSSGGVYTVSASGFVGGNMGSLPDKYITFIEGSTTGGPRAGDQLLVGETTLTKVYGQGGTSPGIWCDMTQPDF